VGLGAQSIKFHYTELITPKWDKDDPDKVFSIPFQPGASTLARLDQFGGLYEQWCLKRCVYKFTPTVGTNQDGSYVAAIDLDAADFPGSRTGIYAVTPRVAKPVWGISSLSVNPSRAMKSRWHMTAHSGAARSPGFQASHSLIIASDKPLIIEVTYEVEMANPTGPWQSMVYTTSATHSDWYGPDSDKVNKIEVRPGASYRLQYAGPSDFWDTFKAGWDTLTQISASTADAIYRVSAIVASDTAIPLAGLAGSAYLSLTGARP
jgi:hypothetical protein